MIQFAKEPLSQRLFDEARPLLEAHWRETEMYRQGNPFRPNLERYLQYNQIGFYQFFTARAEGQLVGNAGMYVTEGMHDQRRLGIEDTFYLSPEARIGRTIFRFLDFVEGDLSEQGVQEVYMTTKLENSAGRVLQAHGYSHVANQYWKRLDVRTLSSPAA